MADTIKPSIDTEDYVSKLVNPTEIWEQDEPPTNDPMLEHEDEAVIEDHVSNDDDPGLPVFNQGQAIEGEPEVTQQPEVSEDLRDALVMTAQEFNEKRKKLTNQDKTEIFSIVMTKLPQEELQKMSLLLEDGITEEELGNLEDVMNAYLEQEEVAKLITILNKY